MRGVNITVGAAHSHRNGVDTSDCRCPWCRQTVSRDELIEIQIRESELISEVEEQVKSRLITERDAEIERVRQEAATAVEVAEQAMAKREAAIRREATATANAAMAPQLAEAAQAKKAAEEQVKSSKAAFEATLKERLTAQAETAAKARVEAVNAVTEKFFGENLRLQERVLELQRMLEKKTANELGDAGELDLFEVLMAEFPQDQIARVPKGVNGPDIVHQVFSGGVFTGRQIVYDSKNHKTFQSKWLPKLRRDQTDYEADHAVLVSTAFPPGKSQLMVENGVIVCSPARAAAIAHMLRRAVLQTHVLGLTNEARDEKTQRLYELLTSDRATERWERLSSATTELVTIETADAAHQQRTRDKRLTKFRAIAAVHDEFTGDIDCIVRGEPEDIL